MDSFFGKQPSKRVSKTAVEATSQPWVEKYRPETINDISAQEHTVAVLRNALTSTNLPHMLFYGPPGTGKTSAILALARQLFGPDIFRSRVLELNASDERGISIVREKVKNFARQTPRKAPVDGQYPCPPYKIIILDEADSMTQDAQGALRRIMETYSKITRFCLVCNYVTRIIEPLASRCSKFRFTPLDVSSTRSRLYHIAQAENVNMSPETFDTLIKVSDGDLRRAITYLQSAARLSPTAEPSNPITPRDIQEIAGVIPDAIISAFLVALGVESHLPGGVNPDAMDIDNLQAKKAAGYDDVRNAVRGIIRQGYSVSQMLIQIHDVVVSHPVLSDIQKARCSLVIAEVDKAVIDGGDEELQLLELGLRCYKALS
ncbi:replication factor C [Cantharellus anzutake]|uniref:replication factor C n=1 Tax=Cantharellus anzutake TaxID=1750568 RepID=UPI0019036268|nr:replication factor C [Cantharellus anzutake]KAF8328815.1 replication factor C [Cantharellus anzutake]